MTSLRPFALSLFITLACGILAAQDFEHHTYAAGAKQAMIVADVNADGWPDVIAWSGYGSKDPGFSVLLNAGNGTFRAPITASTTVAYAVRVADFNGDGKPDVARCNAQGIAIWLGDGTGHFTKSNTVPATCDFAVGDFNYDGRADLAVLQRVNNSAGQFVSNSITVYLGNGAGGFSGTVTTRNLRSPDYAIPFSGLTPADLNRDGFTDFAVGENCDGPDCGGGGHAGVLINDRTGHFTYKRVFDAVINVDRIQISDLNQDGRLDLLVNSQEEDPYIRPLTALLQQPDGSYLPKQIYSQRLESGDSFSFTSVGFGDFDGDGVKDLAFGESHYQEGADLPSQWLRVIYPADNSLSSLKKNVGIPVDYIGETVSADFDRDGRPDIAMLANGNLELYLDRTVSAPVCSAATAPLRSVTLCRPADGASPTSPARIVANITPSAPISAVKVYVDGVSRFTGFDNLVNTFVELSPGPHKVTVKAWDIDGPYSESHTFSVSGCASPSTNRTIHICTPAPGSTVSSPVHVQAQVKDSASVTVKVYVDGVAKLVTTSTSIDWVTTLSAGSHRITVRAWDASGDFSASTSFTVH